MRQQGTLFSFLDASLAACTDGLTERLLPCEKDGKIFFTLLCTKALAKKVDLKHLASTIRLVNQPREDPVDASFLEDGTGIS